MAALAAIHQVHILHVNLAYPDIEFVEVGALPDGRAIAVLASPGSTPGIVWLGGFKSDMMGTKAEARFEFIQERAEFATPDMLDV